MWLIKWPVSVDGVLEGSVSPSVLSVQSATLLSSKQSPPWVNCWVLAWCCGSCWLFYLDVVFVKESLEFLRHTWHIRKDKVVLCDSPSLTSLAGEIAVTEADTNAAFFSVASFLVWKSFCLVLYCSDHSKLLFKRVVGVEHYLLVSPKTLQQISSVLMCANQSWRDKQWPVAVSQVTLMYVPTSLMWWANSSTSCVLTLLVRHGRVGAAVFYSLHVQTHMQWLESCAGGDLAIEVHTVTHLTRHPACHSSRL